MPSFDVTIEVDTQEVDNAINQARKEVSTRYDFRGSDSTIEWDGKAGIGLKTDDEAKLPALLDIVKSKLHKRGVSIRNLEVGDPKPAGGMTHTQAITLQSTNDLALKQAKRINRKDDYLQLMKRLNASRFGCSDERR